jgi:hypothetical protein
MYHPVGYQGNIYLHNMDLLMAYYLQQSINNSDKKLKEERIKEERIKGNGTELKMKQEILYKSPHRDNVCETCGQQLHWCVCSTR